MSTQRENYKLWLYPSLDKIAHDCLTDSNHPEPLVNLQISLPEGTQPERIKCWGSIWQWLSSQLCVAWVIGFLVDPWPNHHLGAMLEQPFSSARLCHRVEKQGMLENPVGRAQASVLPSLVTKGLSPFISIRSCGGNF